MLINIILDLHIRNNKTYIKLVYISFIQASNRFSQDQAGRGGAVQSLRHRQAGGRQDYRAEHLPRVHPLPGDIHPVLDHVAQQSVEPGEERTEQSNQRLN